MRRSFWVVFTLWLPAAATAETGYDAWLRYAPLPTAAARLYRDLPAVITIVDSNPGAPLRNAQGELARGIRGLLGRELRLAAPIPPESAIVIGTLAQVRQALPQLTLPADIGEDGYLLRSIRTKASQYM